MAQPPPSRASLTRQQITTASFEGPIPPPSLLADYNDIIPDAAERILAMAERQSAHRIELEKLAVQEEAKRSYWGLACGTVVALVVAVGATTAIVSGHEIGGTVLGTADLAGIIGTFVYGTESRKRERLSRAELMSGGRE